jgi:hypothetical protein
MAASSVYLTSCGVSGKVGQRTLMVTSTYLQKKEKNGDKILKTGRPPDRELAILTKPTKRRTKEAPKAETPRGR